MKTHLWFNYDPEGNIYYVDIFQNCDDYYSFGFLGEVVCSLKENSLNMFPGSSKFQSFAPTIFKIIKNEDWQKQSVCVNIFLLDQLIDKVSLSDFYENQETFYNRPELRYEIKTECAFAVVEIKD